MPRHAPRTPLFRILATALAAFGALALAGGTALAAPSDGLTTRRVVLTESDGRLAATLRELSPPTSPAAWVKQVPGDAWRPLQIVDRTEHVLWFVDPSSGTELRVDFPSLRVSSRPTSQTQPNPNGWSPVGWTATVHATTGEPEAPQTPPDGLTVSHFVVRHASGGEMQRYRRRAGLGGAATWESSEPGRAWRGPLRIVDQNEHVLWLFDTQDNVELRLEFPALVLKSRPGSTAFPNPAAWTTLPVVVDTSGPAPSDPGGTQPVVRYTFHVRNESGQAVELFQPSNWPPVHDVGQVVGVLQHGQTGTYTAGSDLGWVVRRLGPGKAELQRFRVVRENQLVTVAATSGGTTTPPPPVVTRQRQTIMLTGGVSRLGGWPHLSGDPDMDTNGSDHVPVEVKSRLSFSDDAVFVDVYFYCKEYRGDGTSYGGRWETVGLFSKKNGKIPSDARIVGINPRGGGERSWSVVSVGQQHGLQGLNVRGTYWDDLFFQVDHGGRGDGAHVGVRGTITLEVVVER